MSRSTVSDLKWEVRQEREAAGQTSGELNALDRAICKAMEDRIGESMRASLSSIRSNYVFYVEKGLQSADVAVNAMERGYAELDALLAESEKLLAQAEETAGKLVKP